MGALHDGHLSLLETARTECDLTIASIFVNPTQFSPQEDFRNYPRDLTRDMELLGRFGCDIVFAPTEESMYAPNHTTYVDVGQIGQILEGEFRPTHFRGVATIVLKLFQLVPADRAYFGRKDYQQSIVVRQMVADLNVPIDVRVLPTIREPDGLAMSSRNVYLSPTNGDARWRFRNHCGLPSNSRVKASATSRTIRRLMQQEIDKAGGIKVQYIAFVADGTLTPVARIDGPTTVALAAIVGNTRLIDNTIIATNVDPDPVPVSYNLSPPPMCSELFRIPYTWGGVPIFGVGVLLALWAIVSVFTLVGLIRHNGRNSDTLSSLPSAALRA